MRIAGSIILGVIGAILYFAVNVETEGVSIDMVGVILMIAAAIWFLIEVIRGFAGERVTSTQTVRDSDGKVRETEVREQRRDERPL